MAPPDVGGGGDVRNAVAAVVLLTAMYVVGWSVVPVLDRVALRTVEQHALAWCVFSGGALAFSVAVLVFSGGEASPAVRVSAALHSPAALGSAALTALTQLAYFGLLELRGVQFLIMLLPIVLVSQTATAYAAFREPLGWWKLAGLLVVVAGLVVYNGASFVPEAPPAGEAPAPPGATADVVSLSGDVEQEGQGQPLLQIRVERSPRAGLAP